MREHVSVEALVCAVLAGPPDEASVVARCHEAVAHLPPFVEDALRLLARRFALERATHDDVKRALERAFYEVALTFDEALDDEETIVEAPSEPLALSTYLAESGASVRRWFLSPARSGVMSSGMPPITAEGDLAEMLGLSGERLDALTLPCARTRLASPDRRDHYHRSWVPKRSGGARLLERPKLGLRTAQRRLLDLVLKALPVHEAAHGFVRGRSPRSHALCHAGREVVLSLDLEDFFPSISRARIAGLLRACGYSRAVAASIGRLTTTSTPGALLPTSLAHEKRARYRDPHLPQGAPSSPALANTAARWLDARLSGLAARLDLVYSRYADDLVFSGGSSLARRAGYVEAQVTAIATDEGFSLNRAKSRCVRAGQQQRVTGLVVNEAPAVSRRERDLLEAILVRCARFGPVGENRANVRDFRAHLVGRIGYVAHVRPAHGARLRAVFDQIVW